MLSEWLNELGLSLPEAGESRRIRFEAAPELWLERMGEQYVLALPLAPLPLNGLAGVMLTLLQVNSPMSTLQPARLSADGRGHLLLWLQLKEELDLAACQSACDLLHSAYTALLPLLQEPEEVVPILAGNIFV
ncbi:hypothetical protein ACSZM2_00335 [Aeromonas hydrophila]